ncbi:ChaC-domain-containing protein [Xylaria palmicola]|nr:ChaC-domain-containing protein [Xylaria palmicola]
MVSWVPPTRPWWNRGPQKLIARLSATTDRRVPGWVTGYVRRFWQQTTSQDHRGTPSAPGRVVTLIERSFWAALADAHDSAPEKVWGTAYRIKAAHVEEVARYLDIREINGYTIHYTPFRPADGSAPIRTLVYIGTPENDQFVGPQDPQALAEHIQRSEGPSGLNRDYLLELETALAELSPESGDAHVTDLSDRLRQIERMIERGEVGGTGPAEPVPHEFTRVTSVDEQEETEKT